MEHTGSRTARVLAGSLVGAVLLTAAPVLPVYAEEVAPETREAVLDAGAGSGQVSGVQRSEVLEAPFPFSLVGLRGLGSPDVRVRVRDDQGAWQAWTTLEVVDELDGPDAGTAEGRAATRAQVGIDWVSEPYWVGEADAVQIEVTGGDLDQIDVHVIDSLGHSESLLQRAVRYLSGLTTTPPAEAAIAGPRIVSRAAWGADESIRRGTPNYAAPRFAVLHHTATSNSYSRAEAPGIVRAIYRWHVTGNGWSDIGYNLLVDRYGTIYEGRAGGLERGVVGAHARNNNVASVGISIIGNFEQGRPPQVAVDAAAEALAWKYTVHNIDPRVDNRVRYGDRWVRRLVGHRDVGQTACPGRELVSKMPDMRAAIERLTAGLPLGWQPVIGDWHGTGRDTIGWFREGQWRLFDDTDPAAGVRTITFGQAGDLPVTGDWNGDGRTTIGVVRDGQWLLRDTNADGPADRVFRYGRGAIDHPMAGDWNGDGRDDPAIVRDGEWHLRTSLSSGPGEIVFTYGRVLRGDIPAVGDWDGDGVDTPAILRDRTWHLRNAHSGGPGEQMFVFGRLTAGDLPFAGDWSGDGHDGVGVARVGHWYLRNTLSSGPAEWELAWW